jgi:chemotaxis protein CheZ
MMLPQAETAAEEDGSLSLASDVAEIKSGKVRHADATEILEVVKTIIDSMNRDVPSIDVAVRDDLEDLASYIRETKSEIMNLSPEEISEEHLSSASIELDAIVNATEKATNAIMEATEQIESVGDEVGGEVAEKILNATTQIYEACGFQDITGQRISKVVKAMQEIENKVDDLIGVFGDGDDQAREERRRARDKLRDEKRQEAIAEGELLEGPQLPETAVSQDDIDSLFDSL